ncbi:hypothetical protein [Bdellovibrio sp. KM01]|uniref:hypothetical protein n=1 Tax=Bdellovibrio sp. KM01 TaxID=2748865 RepID=UPI0015EA0671|nr:hypothetical protein [Bdellovibrio sp. KM01]QLY25080.1 hypothetical protein HW988_16920 [Bdellovibrio sp. KM01]
MKKLAVLFFLIHFFSVSLVLAGTETVPYADKFFLEKNALCVTEVIYRHQTDTKIGELTVLPKGTRLYHWEKASSSQINRWNSEGKISEERLTALKKLGGNSGGGFYVSSSPLDSINYGSTAIVVELPKDTILLNVTYGSMLSWNWYLEALRSKGISVISVRHTPTWMNVIDVETLSKIHVATVDDFRSIKISTPERPWSYKKFFKLFPELKNEENFKNPSAEMDAFYKAIKVPGEEGIKAVDFIIRNGSSNMAKEVIEKASVENFTQESIKAAIMRNFFSYNPLFEKLSSDPEKYGYVLLEGFKHSHTASNAWSSMRSTPMDISQRTRILQLAKKAQGPDSSPYVDILIAEYKGKPGQWLPHPLCQEVFQ